MIKCEKKENSMFSIYDSLDVKLLTRLRRQCSYRNENKFRLVFRNIIKAMCAGGSEVENTEHFLLHYHLYSSQRLELFENLEKVDLSFFELKC